MTEKHFIALLFFLISSFSLVAMFREVLTNENNDLIEEKNKERVKVSIQNQSSLIDSVSQSEEIIESSKKEVEKTKEVVVLVSEEKHEIVLEDIEEYPLDIYEKIKDSIAIAVSEKTSEVLENIEEDSSEIGGEIEKSIIEIVIDKIVVPIEISFNLAIDRIKEEIIHPIEENISSYIKIVEENTSNYIKSVEENISNSVKSVENNVSSLAKKCISILLSLLSPEDVKEILNDADVCKL